MSKDWRRTRFRQTTGGRCGLPPHADGEERSSTFLAAAYGGSRVCAIAWGLFRPVSGRPPLVIHSHDRSIVTGAWAR
jgi:hypothetical protein